MDRTEINTFIVEKSCVSLGKMLDHAVYSLHRNAGAFFDLFISTGLAAEFERRDLLAITGKSGVELTYVVMDRCGLEYERVTPRNTTGRSKEFWAGHALARLQAETGFSYREIVETVSVSEVISLYEKYHDKAMNDLPWMLSGEERREAVDEINAKFPEELRKEFKKSRGAEEDMGAGDKGAGAEDGSAGVRSGAAGGAAAAPKSQMTSASAAASKETHLKEMRLRNGLSQSQLAAASGVPLRTIQQYEQRQKNINKAQFEYIVRLSRVLNCEPVQLLEL